MLAFLQFNGHHVVERTGLIAEGPLTGKIGLCPLSPGSCRRRLSRMAARNPSKIPAQYVNGERSKHKDCTYPEAPVAMHAPPVRTGIGLAPSPLFPSALCLFPVISFPFLPCSCRDAQPTATCSAPCVMAFALPRRSPEPAWSTSVIDEMPIGAGLSVGIDVPAGKMSILTVPDSDRKSCRSVCPYPSVFSWLSSNPKFPTRYSRITMARPG